MQQLFAQKDWYVTVCSTTTTIDFLQDVIVMRVLTSPLGEPFNNIEG